MHDLDDEPFPLVTPLYVPGSPPDPDEMIRAAVLKEREAITELLDRTVRTCSSPGERSVVQYLARAIRARP